MLFAHNTSRVEDEPYPTLLRDMGFGGFPSLAFLDATGKKLASPAGRDVATFESTLASLSAWQALSTKKKRSAEEDAQLFVAELELGMLSLDDAKARRATLKKLDEAQAARVDNEILLLEIAAIRTKAGRDAKQANAGFYELAKAGRQPSGPRSGPFWVGVMTHAMEAKDAEVLEAAIEHVRAELGSRPGFENMIKRYVDALEAMKKDG